MCLLAARVSFKLCIVNSIAPLGRAIVQFSMNDDDEGDDDYADAFLLRKEGKQKTRTKNEH